MKKMMGFILYGLLILTAAFSVDLQDLYGTWTWAEEKYGNAAEYGWEEHFMVLEKMDSGNGYAWYDDWGGERDNGYFWLNGSTFVLSGSRGSGEFHYRIDVNPEKANSFIMTPLNQNSHTPFVIEEIGKPLAAKARELNSQKNYEAAVELIQEALESCHFDNSSVYFQLGYALGALGKHVDAIQAYERVLYINPNDTAAAANIEWNKKKLEY